MRRGTTPELTFTLPFEISTIRTIWVTFSQKGKEVFTADNSKCEMNGNEVKVNLSQRDTLRLTSDAPLEIQVRVLTDIGTALASNVIRTTVNRILKEGEIHG